MDDMYLCMTVLGNIKLSGYTIKATVLLQLSHTDDFHAYIPVSEIPVTCCIICLSTLASKTKHNQYHRDQNASKTNTIHGFCCHRNLKGMNYNLI